MARPDRRLSAREVNEVREVFPNFPAPVIQTWLNEYYRHTGWPPDMLGRWAGILVERSPDWWEQVVWTRQRVQFQRDQCVYDDSFKLMTLVFHYGQLGAEIPAIQGGLDRFGTFVDILRKMGSLPQPPVFLQENGGLRVCDGFHRLAAFEWTMGRLPLARRPELEAWVGVYSEGNGW